MRSSVSAGNKTAQESTSVKYRHSAIARREILSFAGFTTQSTGLLDLGLPQTYAQAGTGWLAAFRTTDGKAWLRSDFNPATAATWALPTASSALQLSGSGAATEYPVMRYGVDDAGAVFTAIHDATGVRVRKMTVGAGPSLAQVWQSPYFSTARSDGTAGDLVRRVEAVCPVAGGDCIVAVGVHDYTTHRSTIQFWWLVSGGQTVYKLNSIIQMPFDTAFNASTTHWYDVAKSACFIHAFKATATARIVVVASDQVRGRAVSFTLHNGIESELRPVVPFDAEANSLSFIATATTEINGLFYMTGRWSRTNGDGPAAQTLSYDMLLVSDDGENWSFMERSSYLQNYASNGTLLVPAALDYLYYGGNGYCSRASATPVQNPASNAYLDLISYMAGHDLNEVSNAADTLEIKLDGDIDEILSLRANTHLQPGSVIYLKTGQAGDLADIGAYGIDTPEDADDAETGYDPRKLSARDLGAKTLIEYKVPFDVSLDGLQVFSSDLTDTEDLTLKTPENTDHIKFTSSEHLKYEDLNAPAVWLIESDSLGNVFMRATIKTSAHDTAHLSVIAMIFGCSEDGDGNMVCFPKGVTTAWGLGHQPATVQVRKLKLKAIDDAEPDKEDTGWNLKPRVNGLWESVITDGARSEPATGTYRSQPTFTFTPDTEYDIVVRKSGCRVQAFAKARVMGPETIADSAGFQLVMEFTFDAQDWHAQAGADSGGIALCTDVVCDIDFFGAAVSDNVENQLTGAANTQSYGTVVGKCTRSSYNTDTQVLVANGPTAADAHDTLHAGMVILMNGNQGTTPWSVFVDPYPLGPNLGYVTLIDYNGTSGQMTIQCSGGPAIPESAVQWSIWIANSADTWGWADSGYRTYPVGGGSVQIDPDAQKKLVPVGGRGAFIADATVESNRFVESDGVRHTLYSGSHYATGTEQGWDATSPVSDPPTWRLILAPNRIFVGRPSDYGLPESDPAKMHMLADDEVFRYAVYEFARSGYNGDASPHRWTCVPTYYAPTAEQVAGLSTVTQWTNGTDMPGDDMGGIASAAGLLFELTAKGAGSVSADDGDVYHLAGVTQRTPAAGGSYITLDKPLPVAARGPGSAGADSGDLMIVSGRGQFDTKKVTHEKDTPVVYYPSDSAGEAPWIKVSRLRTYSGRFQTVRDCIERIAGMAGMHKARFRLLNANNTAWTGTLSTTPQTIALKDGAQVANFCLEALVHLVGGSTDAGGTQVTGTRLNITFRNYYRLSLVLRNTGDDNANGYQGNVRVMLSTTNTNASAATTPDPTDVKLSTDGDYAFLEHATVPVTDFNIGGSVALVSGLQYTYTDDVTKLCRVRVTVERDLVVVELNGQLVWVFDLISLDDGAGNDYYVETPGLIQVAYSAAVGAYTATIQVHELGGSLKRHVAQAASTAAANITAIEGGRFIRWREMYDGGVEFGRDLHDSLGTVEENVWRFSWRKEDPTSVNHVLISGPEGIAGEYYDAVDIAANGHKYASEQNDTVNTVEEAIAVAQATVVEAMEFSHVGELSGVGRIHWQPEDTFTLQYENPGSDTPQHAAESLIITSIKSTASVEDETYEATFTVRRAA